MTPPMVAFKLRRIPAKASIRILDREAQEEAREKHKRLKHWGDVAVFGTDTDLRRGHTTETLALGGPSDRQARRLQEYLEHERKTATWTGFERYAKKRALEPLQAGESGMQLTMLSFPEIPWGVCNRGGLLLAATMGGEEADRRMDGIDIDMVEKVRWLRKGGTLKQAAQELLGKAWHGVHQGPTRYLYREWGEEGIQLLQSLENDVGVSGVSGAGETDGDNMTG